MLVRFPDLWSWSVTGICRLLQTWGIFGWLVLRIGLQPVRHYLPIPAAIDNIPKLPPPLWQMEPSDQKVQGGHFEPLTVVLPQYNLGWLQSWDMASLECEGSSLGFLFQMHPEKGLCSSSSVLLWGMCTGSCFLARAVVVKLNGRVLC